MLNIQENVPLAPLTSFRIGGPAKYFVEVRNEEELIEALNYAKQHVLGCFVLGGGSNLLVADKGFSGLVIKMKIDLFEVDEKNLKITAGAGVFLAKVVNQSIDHSLSGMEWAVGIPGTVGGAVRGNARAFGKNAASVVESVKALDIDTLETKTFMHDACEFTYWGSIFKKNDNLVVLSATIKLDVGDKEKSREQIKETVTKRISGQPQGMGSAGSFFLNPVVTDQQLIAKFEQDKQMKIKDDKLPAGWLIDQLDLRGKKIGGAMISEKHANFLVNTGNATADDVVMLMSFVKQQVRDALGIQLQEEITYLGF